MADGNAVAGVRDLEGKRSETARALAAAVEHRTNPPGETLIRLLDLAEIVPLRVDPRKLAGLDGDVLSAKQRAALDRLDGRRFTHRWMLDDALAKLSDSWKPRPDIKVNRLYNRALGEKRRALYDLFRVEG